MGWGKLQKTDPSQGGRRTEAQVIPTALSRNVSTEIHGEDAKPTSLGGSGCGGGIFSRSKTSYIQGITSEIAPQVNKSFSPFEQDPLSKGLILPGQRFFSLLSETKRGNWIKHARKHSEGLESIRAA